MLCHLKLLKVRHLNGKNLYSQVKARESCVVYDLYLLRAQFISNLGSEWTGSHHSKEGLQVSKRGIEKGARGRKEQGDCAMHVNNLYVCT